MSARKPLVVVNNTTAELPAGDTLMGAGFRNKLRNGNAAVNQRGLSGTVTLSAGAYGHDGWKAGAGGATYTFTTSGIDTVISLSAGSLLQVVPAAEVEGGAYAASWSGTATGRIYQGAASGAYAAAPLAFSGLAAAANTTLELTGGTFTAAQLEAGATPTGFERRPSAIELAICQRFFNVLSNLFASAYLQGAGLSCPFSFPTMRATPNQNTTVNSQSGNSAGYPSVTIESNNTGCLTIAPSSANTIVSGNVTVALSAEI